MVKSVSPSYCTGSLIKHLKQCQRYKVVSMGNLEKPLVNRHSTFFFFFFLDRSNYKIREPISGQCWLNVCDAAHTLAERLAHVWGS